MKTRILVLHDEHSSIGVTKDFLRPLEDRLHTRHNIEFIYVQGTYPSFPNNEKEVLRVGLNLDAPIENTSDDCTSLQQSFINSQHDCWESSTNKQSDSNTNHSLYLPRKWFNRSDLIGLDASIYYLHQIWSKEKLIRPFNGIIGIGQGASLAALLPYLREHELEFCGLQFMVLWDAYPLDFSTCCNVLIENVFFKSLVEIFNSSQMSDQSSIVRDMPSLHLVSNKEALALSEFFDKRTIHESATNSPNGKKFNVIGRWCVERRKEARAIISSDEMALLTMQQAKLSMLEEYAAQVVANTVASNPPKALMAIIAPNAVGGWTGEKDRNFNDGGGAPCPREFIMRRQERLKTDDIGVGREHPKGNDE